jgi:hypothetical protein
MRKFINLQLKEAGGEIEYHETTDIEAYKL